MHIERDTPFDSAFNNKEIYKVLCDYFGVGKANDEVYMIREADDGVYIKTKKTEMPVDISGANKRVEWVEVQEETRGEGPPKGEFWYNSPTLIIKWIGVDLAERFDAINGEELKILLKKYYPEHMIISENKKRGEQALLEMAQRSEYEKQRDEITVPLCIGVSTATLVALSDKTEFRQTLRDTNKVSQFERDIQLAVSQSVAVALRDWCGSGLGAHLDTLETMRRIDDSLFKYLQ